MGRGGAGRGGFFVAGRGVPAGRGFIATPTPNARDEDFEEVSVNMTSIGSGNKRVRGYQDCRVKLGDGSG